jgi:GDP-mannose 6-dehydrogenase
VTSACLAEAGHEVIGVDANPEKVAMVNASAAPVVEPELQEAIARAVASGRLRGTMSIDEAILGSDLALICVGTPGRRTGQLDTTAIGEVGAQIGAALKYRPGPYTVVVRSTVLPGTTRRVLVPALEVDSGRQIGSTLQVGVNPEFMREGSSLRDFADPPFTLVGCDDPATASLLESLYDGVRAPFVHTSIESAEMVKYAANAFHALKVSFANEVGDLCDALGADGHEVMRIFRMDSRLNLSGAYLRPGFAFGGSCLPKDLRAMLFAGRTADIVPPVLSAILPSNDAQIRRAVEAVLSTRRRRVGLVGLSFKPGTDDLRESPLVAVAEALIGKGCDLRILDRSVSIARLVGANRRYIEEEIPHIASLMCETVDDLLSHADAVVVGSTSAEARSAVQKASPSHIVIDLTRSFTQPSGSDTAPTVVPREPGQLIREAGAAATFKVR